MRRHLRILEFALSCLLRQRAKHLWIVVIYAFVVFLVSSVLFLTQSLKHEAERLLSGTPELIVQRVSAGRHELIPLSYAETIAEISGVRAVSPRYWGYYYDPPIRASYTFMGVDGLPEEIAEVVEGEMFGEADRFGCLVGQGIAEARMLEPEDIFPVKGSDGELYVLRVKGVFVSESQLLTNDLVVMGVDDLRRIFSMPPGLATDLVVDVPNPAEVDIVALKVLERLPDARPIGRGQILTTYEAVFDWRGGMMLAVLGGCLAAFAVLAWDRASGLSGDERRTIGVLKAVGWDVRDVLELQLWQGVVVSLVSFLTGAIAAHVHVYLYGCVLFAPVIKGWSVLFPELRFAAHAEGLQLLVLFVLTVVPYVFATLVPSWRAAVTDPDLVMRR